MIENVSRDIIVAFRETSVTKIVCVEPKNKTRKTSFEIKCLVLSLVEQLD